MSAIGHIQQQVIGHVIHVGTVRAVSAATDPRVALALGDWQGALVVSVPHEAVVGVPDAITYRRPGAAYVEKPVAARVTRAGEPVVRMYKK